VIVSLRLPLPLEPSNSRAGDGPSLRMAVEPRTLRIRPSPAERGWHLDLEIDVAVPDPEQLLADSEDFQVEGTDGRELGVVERAEIGADGVVSALLVSQGWLGRRRLRIETEAIEAILPAQRLIVVRG
jgi:hypothetical protein